MCQDGNLLVLLLKYAGVLLSMPRSWCQRLTVAHSCCHRAHVYVAIHLLAHRLHCSCVLGGRSEARKLEYGRPPTPNQGKE